MALQFNKVGSEPGISVNETHEAFFELKAALKAQGWTVARSSDGTTYNAAGDQITTAAHLANTRAWFEIANPAGTVHLTFQRVNVNYQFRIKVSPSAFSSGSPAATVTGSSTSETVIQGGGTDASPTGGTLGATTSTARVYQIAVDDAAPWGFYMCGYRSAGATEDLTMFVDPLLSGSYDATDAFPFAVCVVSNPTITTLTTSTPTYLHTRYGSTWQTIGAMSTDGWGSSSAVFPGGVGTDPISGSDLVLPFVYGRATGLSGPNGWKGLSTLFELSGAMRSNADTATVTTTRDHIYLLGGALRAAWNGQIPAV